jgi:hypothetical protein
MCWPSPTMTNISTQSESNSNSVAMQKNCVLRPMWRGAVTYVACHVRQTESEKSTSSEVERVISLRWMSYTIDAMLGKCDEAHPTNKVKCCVMALLRMPHAVTITSIRRFSGDFGWQSGDFQEILGDNQEIFRRFRMTIRRFSGDSGWQQGGTSGVESSHGCCPVTSGGWGGTAAHTSAPATWGSLFNSKKNRWSSPSLHCSSANPNTLCCKT